jgi:hypothetical protein
VDGAAVGVRRVNQAGQHSVDDVFVNHSFHVKALILERSFALLPEYLLLDR